MITEVGLLEGRVTKIFDCFRATSKENVARKFRVKGANVYARKSGG